MKTKRILLCIALLCFLLPFSGRAEYASFAIISDTHIGSSGDATYAAFIRAVDEQKINLILHVGDVINTPGSLNQLTRFLEITGQGKMLHIAPGNHDISGKQSVTVFSKFFPELYHSFFDDDTLFILLNTELPGEEGMVTGKQLKWLETELKKPFRYKFVFLHEPPFPAVRQHGLDRNIAARDSLHQLFAREGVSLVVSGHDHLYYRASKDKITYIITGGSSGERLFFSKPQYMVATRMNGGYSFVAKDMKGNILDKFSLSR